MLPVINSIFLVCRTYLFYASVQRLLTCMSLLLCSWNQQLQTPQSTQFLLNLIFFTTSTIPVHYRKRLSYSRYYLIYLYLAPQSTRGQACLKGPVHKLLGIQATRLYACFQAPHVSYWLSMSLEILSDHCWFPVSLVFLIPEILSDPRCVRAS